jgi:hypothetical protein
VESLDKNIHRGRSRDSWSWVSWISGAHGVTQINARIMLKELQWRGLLEVSCTEVIAKSKDDWRFLTKFGSELS